MASVKELLMDSLKELVEAELKEFHWHLKNAYNKCISKSEMEKADIFDTVDKMVVCFGPDKAVKVMVDILRKMNQNDLAKLLQNEHKQAQAEGNMNISVPVEDDSQQICDQMHIQKRPLIFNVHSADLHTAHVREGVDEFDPKRLTSPSKYRRLIPAVRCCRKAL
ncbi:hypothetical protein QQF64_036170 [Cirrhinus molitorella]|uniref:Pyrin domain-containing protein n=1 Tax=Cirrhinus molitorella TaxID=172907 RepID=A0ABR3NI58_9TELE